ncbi:MAG: DUF3429 domain-containing protein [Gemmatimonadaceae bacterium]|nr:DUF3429 domain-containing protein [Gemmatimonadaceae bacterium]
MSSQRTLTPSAVPRGLWVVAGSGLLPFLTCLALLRADDALAARAVQAFIVYAALTLSFLGGARWGAELVRQPDAPVVTRLAASAVPSVVGLAALLPSVSATAALLLLMACGVGQLVWDVGASRAGLLPAWNARVRTVMTLGGTLCTAAMLVLKPV